MAEARREEEEEELRDIRNRNQATDRTERNKSEALHSSQGPLSSIRAAIKRTRTSTQSEQTRDRRRPEITILSAEPLAANGWFPGASGGFTAPSQPIWGGSIQSDTQPPPSYDQVIKEKTQETVVTPTATPRRSTTIATQTDPVEDDTAAGPECTAASQPIEKRQSTVKIKPPRPYLPKPLQSDSTTATAVSDSGLIQVDATATNTKNQTDPKSAAAQPSPTDASCAIPNTRSLSPSVSVQWDGPIKPSEPSTITTFLEPTVPVATERPIPLPRSKSCKQTITEEVKVQTLVRLSDSGSSSVDDTAVEAPPSGKYLQELLDVFCPEDQCDQNTSDNQTPTDVSDQSEEGDEDGNMAALHSQRNIRARIQAFESQEGDGEPEFKQPEPLPRNTHLKPPVVSAKPAPALAPKPSIKKPSNGSNYQGAISIFSTPFTPSIPTPAPRPMLHRKPSIVPEPKESEPEARSRLSKAARAKNLFPQEEDEPRLVPPISPEKPRKEPLGLNLNNHNSASITTTEAVNEYMDNPTNYIPVNPVCSDVGGGGSFSRQTVTRRPTTIRVPSKGNLFDGTLDNPPPLPAQKPVGSLPPPVTRKQSISTRFPFQESFDSEPIPGLPPRPGGAKVLPPRPPPAKVGPGRPPPPRINGPRQSLSTRRAPASSAAPSPKQPQAQKPKKKGPVLPPRPNPGHRLYNQYTLGLPHGIAEFDYSGRDTGELSFQGVSTVGSRRGSSGLQVQVLHDFTPEGPGELGLREGDVVTNVEQVDSEWYRGSCRGSSGFFPVSYVKVMSNAPTLTNTKKARPPPATVSGPRCVARFDFEGEQSDELTFSEGDVIQLKEYMEEEWARGQIGAHTGIFPINFVDIIEDLPPLPQPQRQQSFPTKMALPGMVSSTKTQEAAKPIQSGSSGVEWAVALYDFVGQAEEELSFQQGDRILVTQHVDAEWCYGRLNGREGFFPTAFIETSSGNSPVLDRQQSVTNGEGSRGKALFDFTAECEEELSLKAGDIITNVESIDDEWFLGELRGKRALVPKNYMQVLA
ncbi:SH3 domain-containing protein 19-like isoform X2 [Oncorhynchus clarkii lewisi]|uniref:SH3 domain-containing protein 19-like isoform X2 n=1 Tax=Oncorhynchus clarkii lewisi TaxID=490388 RepID=UPI0039B91804